MTIQEQFQDLKKKHPDAVLLFRCGDFYETYHDDAATISQILGITLTKRSKDSTRMAGFPHHALDTYLPRLIRHGKRVAIVDEEELNKFYKSNNSKTPNETMETKTTIPTENNEKMYHKVFNRPNFIYYEPWNKLVRIDHYHISYDLDAQTEEFTIELAGGLTLNVPFDTPFYKSKEDYIKQTLLGVFIMKSAQDIVSDFPGKKINHNGRRCYLVDNGGKPTYIDIEKQYPRFTISDVKFSAPDYKMPTSDEIFGCLEDYYKWNDLAVIGKDGEETIKHSLHKSLLLTPEQRTLFDAVKDAIEAARKGGICFFHSSSEENLYAVNRKAFLSMECDSELYGDTEGCDTIYCKDFLRLDNCIGTDVVYDDTVFLCNKLD